jgi:hypothetical protein
MPTLFYVVMSCIALFGVLGITAAVIVGTKVKAKTRRLLADMRRDDAVVQSECMIRDGAIQCPGVALVADGTLIIRSVFDKRREFPITSVALRKEGPAFGWYPWWGKRVLYLDTPETSNLAIGVKNPGPWRTAFQKTGTS